jgi:hypothetical protein
MNNRLRRSDWNKLKAAGCYALAWNGLFSFFGLIQLWIIFIITIIDKSRYTIIQKWINDGFLLFFLTALVTTITIDYIFDTTTKKKIQKNARALDTIIMFVVPVITFLFVLTFYLCVFFEPESINLETYYTVQTYTLIVSAIYSLAIKFLLRLIPSWNKP